MKIETRQDYTQAIRKLKEMHRRYQFLGKGYRGDIITRAIEVRKLKDEFGHLFLAVGEYEYSNNLRPRQIDLITS